MEEDKGKKKYRYTYYTATGKEEIDVDKNWYEILRQADRDMQLFPTPKGNSYIKANEELLLVMEYIGFLENVAFLSLRNIRKVYTNCIRKL